MSVKPNKDLKKICIKPGDTIRSAFSVMAKNRPRETFLPASIVVVVDESKRLLGIATGGDLGRALSRGATLDTAISSVMNKKPFCIEGAASNSEIISLVSDKVRKEQWHRNHLDKIIIVDRKKRLVDLLSLYDLWQGSDIKFKHIGVVGLGYVGLTLALTLADVGFKVKGFDTDPKVMRSLSQGKSHILEPGLDTFLKDYLGKNFYLVPNFSGSNNCDVYFVAVGTPLKQGKTPNLSYLKDAATNIGKVLKNGDTVILRSTVPIAVTRKVVLPILERVSGLHGGQDFLLAFAPERTVEGKALEELRALPQIVGGLNHASADAAANIFSFITNSTVFVNSLEEAEMVKLINNTYRDVTFGFANEVSLISRRWGVDTKRVIEAANHGYERSRIPMPSPGVGGYCLEKDPFIFALSAREKNYEPLLFLHARRVSDQMISMIAVLKIKFRHHNSNDQYAMPRKS